MGAGQRIGHFVHDADHVTERQLLLAIEPVAQRFAFHERHDVNQKALFRNCVGIN